MLFDIRGDIMKWALITLAVVFFVVLIVFREIGTALGAMIIMGIPLALVVLFFATPPGNTDDIDRLLK